MKKIIAFEEAGITIAALLVLSRYSLDLPFWAWFLLFFSPDISMLGYLAGPRIGAFTYNLFHHRGIAALVGLTGVLIADPVLTASGTLLFAHASFDRVFGYGLKYTDDFKHTHLGWLGGTKR